MDRRKAYCDLVSNGKRALYNYVVDRSCEEPSIEVCVYVCACVCV